VLTNFDLENKDKLNVENSEAEAAWEKFLEIIRSNISELKLNTWFKPIRPRTIDSNALTIVVPSKDYYDMIISRFGTVVSKAVIAVLGDTGRLVYEIEAPELPFAEKKEPEKTEAVIPGPVQPQTYSGGFKQSNGAFTSESYFNSEYSFDNFVKGKNNEFATAAAQSICNKPGAHYNPLMIYGGVGLGKTHLIQAIGNQLKNDRPKIKIMYISGPEFTTSFVQSIRTNKAHEFERFYKSLDILIVDDVQFLEGKESTQDSFFQIFNSLYQLKRQIVLSSDKPPHQLTGLEERLITRFQWGLTVDIQPPDLETRIAILNKKSEVENVSVPYEVMEFIAINIKDNIRSLEGCLKSLIFDSELTKTPINLDMAKRSVVKFGAIKSRKQNMDIGSIIAEVAKFFDLEESLLRLKTKRQEIVTARHAAMFICREMTSCSLETIGAHFGGRNHATVIHACKCVEDMMTSDSGFKDKLERIKENLLTS
jgi:chromosomal replication initiator protein